MMDEELELKCPYCKKVIADLAIRNLEDLEIEGYGNKAYHNLGPLEQDIIRDHALKAESEIMEKAIYDSIKKHECA